MIGTVRSSGAQWYIEGWIHNLLFSADGPGWEGSAKVSTILEISSFEQLLVPDIISGYSGNLKATIGSLNVDGGVISYRFLRGMSQTHFDLLSQLYQGPKPFNCSRLTVPNPFNL